jgi:hypothetical protein
MIHVHVAVVRNTSNVAESKVNKGIAGIDAIKKSEKSWIRYLLDTLKHNFKRLF